jgi:hypothetical protein
MPRKENGPHPRVAGHYLRVIHCHGIARLRKRYAGLNNPAVNSAEKHMLRDLGKWIVHARLNPRGQIQRL